MNIRDLLAKISPEQDLNKAREKDTNLVHLINEFFACTESVIVGLQKIRSVDEAQRFYAGLYGSNLPLEVGAALTAYACVRVNDEREEATRQICDIPITVCQVVQDASSQSSDRKHPAGIVELFLRYAERDPSYWRIPVNNLPDMIGKFASALGTMKSEVLEDQNVRTYEQLVMLCNHTFGGVWERMIIDLSQRLKAEEAKQPRNEAMLAELNTNIACCSKLRDFESKEDIKLTYLFQLRDRFYKALGL